MVAGFELLPDAILFTIVIQPNFDMRRFNRFCAISRRILRFCRQYERNIFIKLLQLDFPDESPNTNPKGQYMLLKFGVHIYAFGLGSHGQLGHGGTYNSQEPHIIQIFKNISLRNVVQVSCGHNHTAFVTTNGTIYTFGNGQFGQLGHGHHGIYHELSPQQIAGYGGNYNNNVKQVSCGDYYTAFTTTNGKIYTFGIGLDGRLGHNSQNNELIPRQIVGFDNVKQVSCGRDHTAFVTSNNQVFTFGRGWNGELGHNSDNNELIPRQIVGFNNVKQVSCGLEHTAFVTVDSQVFTFGYGKYGRLGHGSHDIEFVPRRILDFNNVIQVSCQIHTAFITSDGKIFTFGLGEDGRLGHGRSRYGSNNELIPRMIAGFDNVIQVSCGGRHTAFVTSDNQVFLCGCGEDGRLGNGSNIYELVPRAIKSFNNIVQVSCGVSHTTFLTR